MRTWEECGKREPRHSVSQHTRGEPAPNEHTLQPTAASRLTLVVTADVRVGRIILLHVLLKNWILLQSWSVYYLNKNTRWVLLPWGNFVSRLIAMKKWPEIVKRVIQDSKRNAHIPWKSYFRLDRILEHPVFSGKKQGAQKLAFISQYCWYPLQVWETFTANMNKTEAKTH